SLQNKCAQSDVQPPHKPPHGENNRPNKPDHIQPGRSHIESQKYGSPACLPERLPCTERKSRADEEELADNNPLCPLERTGRPSLARHITTTRCAAPACGSLFARDFPS